MWPTRPRRSPSTRFSFGNGLTKARRGAAPHADGGLAHARRAVALAPEFPPNQLCLAEALAAVDDREESRRVLNRALTLVREWQNQGEPEADEWLAEIDAATMGGWAK